MIGSQGDDCLGIAGDGTLWAFKGEKSFAGAAAPTRLSSARWVKVAQGGSHLCAIDAAQRLYCKGENHAGQLGTGNKVPAATLGETTLGGAWSDVSTGRNFSCGITSASELYCWGANQNGQVGAGLISKFDSQLAPRRVGGADTFLQVSAGHQHACAVRSDHSLWCWGADQVGQLGYPANLAASLEPALVAFP